MSKKRNPISFAILCALLVVCAASTGCKIFGGSSGPTLGLKVGMSWDEAQTLLGQAGAKPFDLSYLLLFNPERPHRTWCWWNLPNGTQITMYGDKDNEQDALIVDGFTIGDSSILCGGKNETWYSFDEVCLAGKRVSIVGCDGNYLVKGMTADEARAAIERAGLSKADSAEGEERYLLDTEREWFVTVVYAKGATVDVLAKILVSVPEGTRACLCALPKKPFECEFLHLDRPMANWTRD